MRKDIAGRALEFGRSARNVQRLVRDELKSTVKVPLRKRAWAWRRGFMSRSAVRYGLTDDNLSLYVSDWARYVKTPRINGEFACALNNKIIFSRILASYGCTVPEYYCLIRDGVMFQIGDCYQMRSAADVIAACHAGGHFVIKPYTGGSGVRVTMLRGGDGELLMNGKTCAEEDATRLLEEIESGTITEFLEQHEYASRIFPHSPNTIRVLTMWDLEKKEPFIPFAGQRFGRPSSVPVDNCSRGGLATPVDVATGELGVAQSGIYEQELVEHEVHPDTGEQITGVRIPRWEHTTSRLLEICREMSYIPYVGWDVMITPDGFAVIEGNNYPDLGHQAFKPLLSEPRVRAFYEWFDAL
jgi:hypothetical protein